MTAPRISAAVHKALAECETVEEIAEVFDAVKSAKCFMVYVTTRTPADNDGLRSWLGLPEAVIRESPPCQAWADPPKTMHFDALARHGATDTRSMMFRLLKLARRERSRIEKIPFHPRRVKDDIKHRHAEILKEARAFRSFPDYRRLP